MSRKYGKPDANQSPILKQVKELNLPGLKIFDTKGVGRGFPDLVIGVEGLSISGIGPHDCLQLAQLIKEHYPFAVISAGCNFLGEVKTETGKLQENQKEFRATWPGPYKVIREVEDILRIVGRVL